LKLESRKNYDTNPNHTSLNDSERIKTAFMNIVREEEF